MKSLICKLTSMDGLNLRSVIIPILIVIFNAPVVYSEEMGFVALSEGYANYDHLGEEQKATSSFFLVDLFDDYNIALGAIILNSHQQIGDSRTEQLDADTDVFEIELDNVKHSAWGTLLAYSVSSESLLGIQGWAGVGYLSNTLEFEGTTISLYRYSDDAVQLCELSLKGKSGEVKSLPLFIGIGITVWGFGFFAQYMEQKTEPLKVNVSVTDNCTIIIGSDTFSDAFKDSYKTEIESSFKLISTGIQYRF